eukprot:Opistho-2@49591
MEIRAHAGHGRAAFAVRDYAIGDVVHAETSPLMVWSTSGDKELNIVRAFVELSASSRSTIRSHFCAIESGHPLHSDLERVASRISGVSIPVAHDNKNAKKDAESISDSTRPPAEKDDILGILCIAAANAHRIGNNCSALFPTAAMASHSCVPNMRLLPHPETALGMRYAAIRAIKAGELLTYSYVAPNVLILPTNNRREMLYRSWGFVCECEGCAGQYDASRTIKCPSGHSSMRPPNASAANWLTMFNSGTLSRDGGATSAAVWFCAECGRGQRIPSQFPPLESTLCGLASSVNAGQRMVPRDEMMQAAGLAQRALGPRHWACALLSMLVAEGDIYAVAHPDECRVTSPQQRASLMASALTHLDAFLVHVTERGLFWAAGIEFAAKFARQLAETVEQGSSLPPSPADSASASASAVAVAVAGSSSLHVDPCVLAAIARFLPLRGLGCDIADGHRLSRALDDLKWKCCACGCAISGEISSRSACGGCKTAAFCGVACMKAAWPRHKRFCKGAIL